MKTNTENSNNSADFTDTVYYRFILKIIAILFIGLVLIPVLAFSILDKKNTENKFKTEFRFSNYYDEAGKRKPNPEPQQIYGPIYSVGPLTVCAYLVKTEQGLIMFDAGYDKDGSLISDNIRKLSMDPKDIKKIFVTHWHGDHSSGSARLSELSGAEILIHKDDVDIVKDRVFTKDYMIPAKDRIVPLEDREFFNFGDVLVKVLHTPGQTSGEVVYLLTVDGPQGKCQTLVAGDATAMKSTVEEIEPNKFPGIVQAYEKTVDILKSLEFDLYLGGHPHQVFKEMREDGNPFVTREQWHKMVDNRNQQKIDFLIEHPEYINY
ncbi:MBL fold metallo-hydrolase [Maribellus sediminis]|uniref:MBL fold metallo-hydrolase n=1 Tax=Maribellus sediminis TaxID=2696285 RepID=UPI0014309B0E|nr:MBL fold metallo-hydrolase [Maribellus sediminis]